MIVTQGTVMELSDEEVRDFIDLWQTEFKETLKVDQAREEIRKLLDFYNVLHEIERKKT